MLEPTVRNGVRAGITAVAVVGGAGVAALALLPTPPSAGTVDLGRYEPPPGASYLVEEARVRCFEGHSLGATLTLPGRGVSENGRRIRYAAVLLIGDSHGRDRDGGPPESRADAATDLDADEDSSSAAEPKASADRYRPLYDLADTLARRGIAAMRLDDRGVGASTGSYESCTALDRARDFEAALEYLRRRADINPMRIAVLGIGEGGWIATMLASREVDIYDVALLATPAASGRAMAAWEARRSRSADTTLSAAARDSAIADDVARWEAEARGDSWLRFDAGYDPLAIARQVSAPTLVLQGNADRSISPDDASRLAGTMRSGASRDVTVRLLPGIDHTLLAVTDPDSDPWPAGYRLPPAVRGAVAEWLAPRLGPPVPAPPFSHLTRRGR